MESELKRKLDEWIEDPKNTILNTEDSVMERTDEIIIDKGECGIDDDFCSDDEWNSFVGTQCYMSELQQLLTRHLTEHLRWSRR